MYNEEWEPVMTADSMEERVEELASLASSRAEGREQPIEDVVYEMMHTSYLEKHTTSDVLAELDELQASYPEEFYRGDAAEHIMKRINELGGADVWTDYLYVSLAAGLEWAVLEEIDERD